jgi:mycofactocin biosynthetic radical S-adenosylmethionine protein MftC
MTICLDDRLSARLPSFRDERDGRTLLVWGDVGQWLVLDAEAARLFALFGRERAVSDALREHCRATAAAWETALCGAMPLLDALVERGLLGSPPGKPSPPPDPLRLSNLTFNITNRCNLQCSWCYNPPSSGGEVDILALVDWMAAGADSLGSDIAFIILGGEPFLDQGRLVQCVRAAREYISGEILISTNGTLLDPETPAALASASATVQVSLDSAFPSKHDAVRGKGVFHRAIASAQRLADAGVRTILSMVMTRGCEDEFEPYFDLAMKTGVHEVRFIPLRRIGRGLANSAAVPDLYACFRRLVEILRARPRLSRLLERDFFSILMKVCRISRLRTNCGIGRRCLFVDADGTIFPCPNHRNSELQCGHVLRTPLANVLDDSPVVKSMRLRYRMEEMPTCLECAFRYWCAGDCRAEVLSVTGDPRAPSPYCEPLRKTMTDLFWLIAEGWQGLASTNHNLLPWS